MAAAPVRQRSAAAGPRSQLPPCYYEGYLEKRGPREKVGPSGVAAMLSRLHVVASGGQGACACAGHRLISHPEAVNFLIVLAWARREWTLVLPQICLLPTITVLMSALGKNLVGKRAAMCEQMRYQPGGPLLSKHCHLNHVARRICGSYLNQTRLPNIFSPRNHVLISLFWETPHTHGLVLMQNIELYCEPGSGAGLWNAQIDSSCVLLYPSPGTGNGVIK